MKLYVMRHGPSEDQAPTGRDFDRVLSPEGRERVRLVARELHHHGEVPKRVIASPLVRAVETAEIVTATLGIQGPIEEDADLVPGGDAEAVVRALVSQGAEDVLLVSHEPTTSHLAAQLLPGWVRPFETAMVLGLELRPGSSAKRRFLLEPKTLTWRMG